MIQPFVCMGLISVALVAGPAPATSQEPGMVSGRVFARASGTPFIGAHVTVAGTAGSARTDSAGRYVLSQVPAGVRQLEVTIAGYGTVSRRTTVVSRDTSLLDFELLPPAIEPDLVLDGVAGAPARRREVGQSVAIITGDELMTAPVATLNEALQGRLPGVLVLNASGFAGAGRQLQLRGAGSFLNADRPLVLIDGVRVADLPYPAGPQSAQSPDPLDDLDPAAIDRVEVIRGPSAGLLFGREAAGGVIHVFTRRGSPGRPAWSFAADQGARWLGHVGPDRPINPDGLGLNDCRFAPGCPAGNSWLRTGHDQRYRASVRGGGEGALAGYFVSGTWGRESGVIAPQRSADWKFRANLHLRPLPSLKISGAGAYAQHDVRWIPRTFLADVLAGIAVFNPGGNDSLLLVPDLDQGTGHATGGVSATWTPLPGFSHRLTAGLDRARSRYRYDWPAGLLSPSSPAFVQEQDFKLQTLTAQYAGEWHLPLGRASSRLFWSAGLRDQTSDDSTFAGSGDGFELSRRHAEGTVRGFSVEERVGIGGRLFVSGGVRWDDATAEDTTGLEAFPAAQVSYVVSDNGFWPGWWEALRLRFAVGQAGSPLRLTAIPAVFFPGPGLPPGVQPLLPERTRELEAGLESSLFGGRLRLEYTYYAQHTSHVMALVQASTPFGFFETVRNVGALSNRGHELVADVRLLRGRAVTWDLGAHWSTNHSEASDVGNVRVAIFSGSGGGLEQRMQDSLAVPSNYGRVVANPDELGVAPVWEDRLIGPVYPTFAYGLSTRLTLGGRIVLTALGEGQGGHWLPSTTAWRSVRLGTWPECIDVQEKMLAGDVAGLTARQQGACDRFLASLGDWTFPADFFRVRHASLMYRMPESWFPGAGRAWIGVTARNPLLLTSYRGVDPEAITGGSTEGAFGSGFRSESFELPHPRSVGVSLKIEW